MSAPVSPEVPPVVAPPQPDVAAQLQEMNRKMEEQRQEIARLSNVANSIQNPPPPPPQTPDFYTDPKGAIREEVRQSIAPLNAFMQMFQNTQTYNANKATLLNSFPNLQPYWSQVQPKLDQIFASGEVAPTMQNLGMAVNNIMGQLLMANPNFAQPSAPSTLPPSIGSAPPIVPPVNPANPVIQLTENQKIIARHNGQTDEEFARGLVGQTIIRV